MPLWAARLRDGRVRECHGELHLSNVLQLAGEATAFDGIEFDDALRWIDVLDDIAFLAMDLLAHGQRAFAFRFVNAYPAASGDYDGLPTLRFFMVCRALVRAQVTSHKSDVGGVHLNLHDAAELGRAADEMLARVRKLPPQARIAGFTVQSMAKRPMAQELIVGASIDPLFGPVLLFGQGGTAVEVLADRAIALPPLNRALARELVSR